MSSERLAGRGALMADLLSGLTSALVYIPKGMALALVAGVNPIHGLYAGMIAPLVAAFLTGSSFMVVVATNELAVPVSGILAGVDETARVSILLALALLIGVFQIAFGVLRLGSIVRFISESVMTGFVVGVAVLMILGQLAKLTGYHGHVPGNAIVQAADWVMHLRDVDGSTTLVGLATIAIAILVHQTRARGMALIIAIACATALASFMDTASVALVGDSAQAAAKLPMPVAPHWPLMPGLFLPALSLAMVGLAVSAGISQTYEEPNGDLPSASRDFVGQGIANLAAGIFQGMPVGGSFSQTAVSVSAGAKTRMASVFLAVLVAVAFAALGGLVKLIPLSALAGLLIFIGFEMIKPVRIARVRGTHPSERFAMIVTFVLTLTIPIQYAILAGVALTIGLYIYSSSVKIRIVEIVALPDGRFEERAAPPEIPSNKTTVLGAYGNAFFAAVYTLERGLPSADKTSNAVIVLTMRGRDVVMTSFLALLERYAKKLEARGNRLVLCGVEPQVKTQLERSGTLKAIGSENVFTTTPILGDSMSQAVVAADAWVRIASH